MSEGIRYVTWISYFYIEFTTTMVNNFLKDSTLILLRIVRAIRCHLGPEIDGVPRLSIRLGYAAAGRRGGKIDGEFDEG